MSNIAALNMIYVASFRLNPTEIYPPGFSASEMKSPDSYFCLESAEFHLRDHASVELYCNGAHVEYFPGTYRKEL